MSDCAVEVCLSAPEQTDSVSQYDSNACLTSWHSIKGNATHFSVSPRNLLMVGGVGGVADDEPDIKQ